MVPHVVTKLNLNFLLLCGFFKMFIGDDVELVVLCVCLFKLPVTHKFSFFEFPLECIAGNAIYVCLQGWSEET